MQLNLDLGSDEVAIQDAVARFCDHNLGHGERSQGPVPFSRALWRSLARLGLIEAFEPTNPAGQMQACVALEVLGGAGFPGPAPQALAAAVGLSGEDWVAVAAGDRIATFGLAPIVPWAFEADIILIVEGERLRRVTGGCEAIETLASTRSGRVSGTLGDDCGPAGPALARYDMAVAAFVQGAGRAAVEAAADHARARRQFGKAIGEFQAVAFPLAEALMGLNAARIITRFAATAIDNGRADAPALASAARLSACRAALKGCFAAHQTFGAAGQLLDGPVARFSLPIQEYAVQTRSLKDLRAQIPLGVVGALELDAWAT